MKKESGGGGVSHSEDIFKTKQLQKETRNLINDLVYMDDITGNWLNSKAAIVA